MNQAERITQVEQATAQLYKVGQESARAGLIVSRLGAQLERKVALNTASIESFERTIANMQAQIDKLTAEASNE